MVGGDHAQQMVDNLCVAGVGVNSAHENDDVREPDDKHEEDCAKEHLKAYDVQFGNALDHHVMQQARHDEMAHDPKWGVYEPATVDECLRVAGRPHTQSKRVGMNKGHDDNPQYKRQWVGGDSQPTKASGCLARRRLSKPWRTSTRKSRPTNKVLGHGHRRLPGVRLHAGEAHHLYEAACRVSAWFGSTNLRSPPENSPTAPRKRR